MSKQQPFTSTIIWTGDRGQGTAEYHGYDRTWEVRTPGKPVIQCSNDPLLGGDPARPNPEDLLLASLSACHMLWYLHLACKAGIVVTSYADEPVGMGETSPNGAGRFLRATLRPTIGLRSGADLTTADALHRTIHQYCFIARSVNFPIDYEARYIEETLSTND
jgi:organic hydroperoxide reductase OsmC/OhrA